MPARLLVLLATSAVLVAACSGEPTDDALPDIDPPADAPALVGCLDPPDGEVVISASGSQLAATDHTGAEVDLQLGGGDVDADLESRLADALGAHDRTIRATAPDGAGPHPVLLEFHGYSGNAAGLEGFTRFREVAVDAGYLVVAVDGREDPRRWELTSTSPEATAMASSDVAVVDAVVDLVLAPFCGDPDQLHAAGISNGSVFAAVLACHSRHDVAAVGSVAFTTGRAGCDDDRQVPTLAFHGTADVVVPYAGQDVPLIRAVLGWALEPAEEAMAAKAALNGCDGFDDEVIGDDVLRRTWHGCDAETVFYRVEGGGHGWPGPGQPSSGFGRTTTTIDATELIVDFFDRN